MSRNAILSFVLFAAACGGEAGEIQVELNLTRSGACELQERCGPRLRTSGLVMESDGPGDGILLYADVQTASGALAVLELSLDDGGGARVRYHEISGGEVTFRGTIEDQRVAIDRVPGELAMRGGFAFRAIDGAAVRVVTAGTVLPNEVEALPRSAAGSGGGTSTEVVVVVETGGPRRPPPPDDEDLDSGGGCDDGGSSSCGGSSSDSGCDDSGGDSGCDDSGDSGCDSGGGGDSGCDSGSGSGCEGDVADSAGGCDCEGDLAARGNRHAFAGLWRLAWPVAITGWWNRRMKRRQARRERSSSR
jgi:hypothetical protein